MNRLFRPSRAAAVLLALAGALAWAAPAWAAQPWLRAESRHFSLLAQTSEATARKRLAELERQQSLMLMALGVPERGARSPAPLLLVSDPALIARVDGTGRPNLHAMTGATVDGFPLVALDVATVAVNPLLFVNAHRVSRRFARAGQPDWYSSGLGNYFGNVSFGADAVEIGGIDTFLTQLEGRRWMDLAEVLKSGEVPSHQQEIYTAQAWLLTHYAHSDVDRLPRFNAYLQRVAVGEDALAALEPATGLSVDALTRELRRHLRKLGVVHLPTGKAPDIRITAVAEAQALAEVDAIAIAAWPTAETGKSLLQSLRDRVAQAGGEQAPDVMRWALAYAETRFGDPERALLLLSPWARQDPAPFEANRLLGWAWLAEAERSQGADRDLALKQARAFLVTAHKQRPDDAPTLYHLARALQAAGNTSVTLSNVAEAAALLEPSVTAYTELAAQAHLQTGDRARALRSLRALVSSKAKDEQANARAALLALQSNETPATALALLNAPKKPNKKP
ncbi:hypothetical protein [Roseateles sp. LYH14W]|uniref:Tetratricopeptide repeat protein n=1 Tax=Pelomonas parva TaxID=3299032 RepID=A0ABW7FAV5_9BURK